jgi:hypothetical protein
MSYDYLADLGISAREKADSKQVLFSKDFLFQFIKNHPQMASAHTYYVKNGICRIKLTTQDQLIGYLDLKILETGGVERIDYLISPHIKENH